MIPAAEVILLMPQDVAPLRFRQGGGQVDLGPEQAHDEGGGDVVRQIDVVLQPHGPHQAAAEPQQRDHAVKEQQGHARQPRQGQDRYRAAEGRGWGGGRLSHAGGGADDVLAGFRRERLLR